MQDWDLGEGNTGFRCTARLFDPVLFSIGGTDGRPLAFHPYAAGNRRVGRYGSVFLSRVVARAVAACLIADLCWYWLGIHRGSKILNLLCKISLEPDSCVKRTENCSSGTARRVLFAKFVPGLSTAAAPLAGMFRMKIWKFAMADGAGALIWAGTYSALGFVFRNQLDALRKARSELAAGLLPWPPRSGASWPGSIFRDVGFSVAYASPALTLRS